MTNSKTASNPLRSETLGELELRFPASWQARTSTDPRDPRQRTWILQPPQGEIWVDWWPGQPGYPGGILVADTRTAISVAGVETQLIRTKTYQSFDEAVWLIALQRQGQYYRIVGRNVTEADFREFLQNVIWKY